MMKWGHLPVRALSEPLHAWYWGGTCSGRDAGSLVVMEVGIMCGGVSALRSHPCNLLSIVGDYYALFNYSDDIYQGQLYSTTSCRENGLSVSPGAGRRVHWSGPFDLCLPRECPHKMMSLRVYLWQSLFHDIFTTNVLVLFGNTKAHALHCKK